MPIEFSVDDGIATIVFNRPERLNSFDPEHYAALSKAFLIVRDDPSIRVGIVTGAGDRSFSIGADIKVPIPRPDNFSELILTPKDQLPHRGLELWKPIIAAVNGCCLDGGMCILMATDIRIAAEHATFGLSEVKRGGVPGNGGSQRILQQLPYPVAMEMLLTGETIDAAAAAHWGLVNKVIPQSKLMVTALDYARRLASGAPLAVQAAKELAIRSRDADLATGLRIERSIQALLNDSHDRKENGAAFAEKRSPGF
jgi:E-phenylitaconyl-CoA hydratase